MDGMPNAPKPCVNPNLSGKWVRDVSGAQLPHSIVFEPDQVKQLLIYSGEGS